jgi:hypothetical protein
MEREWLWKNFNLGKELSNSGAFIYNGLKAFDDLETFYNDDQIFEFLYNIAVGIERLLKVAVILIEYNDVTDQVAFEQSIKTHNHTELIGRIKQKYKLKLGKVHNSFLLLLGNFYKSMRYERFNLREAFNHDLEKQALKRFLLEEFDIIVEEDTSLFQTQNDYGIKKRIGKIIGKITDELYKIVDTEAHNQNIYTGEVRFNSKAYKIFLRKEFDFQKENVLWKELLIYILSISEDNEAIIDFMKQIEPLDFDSVMLQEYLMSFHDNFRRLEHLDELDALYEDLSNKNRKERLEALEIIGSPGIYFRDDISEEDMQYFDET